jgi:DNA (cytosine-5)-methyltransferase 3A
MTILSLFDGISCGYLALLRAGIPIETYCAYEIDKYALAVSQKRFPKIQRFGDVRNGKFCEHKTTDLLIGGSPCQDLSIAKTDRQGLSGSRSSLFFEFVRALNEVNPKYFLFENVASMRKEDRNAISKELGAEPVLINSALVSAQQRKRLYWTNIPNIKEPENKKIAVRDILEGKENLAKQEKYGKIADKPLRIGSINGTNSQWARVYSVRGKSVVINANGGGKGARTGLYKINMADGSSTVRPLTSLECERLQTLPDNFTDVGISTAQRYKCIGNGWTADVIAHILSQIKMKRISLHKF